MVDLDPAVVGRDVAILVSQQVFPVFVAPTRRANTAPEGMPQIVDPQVPKAPRAGCAELGLVTFGGPYSALLPALAVDPGPRKHALFVPAPTSKLTVSARGLADRDLDVTAVEDGDLLDVLLEAAPPRRNRGESR